MLITNNKIKTTNNKIKLKNIILINCTENNNRYKKSVMGSI